MTAGQTPTSIRFVEVEVDGVPGQQVRIVGDRVVEVGPSLHPDVDGNDEQVVDGHGGALIPGLHDHHIHLRAAAAVATSVRVGPPDVVDESGLAARLRAAARAGPGNDESTGWIRAIGYHESVAGPLDRHSLDAFVADRPLRVQHRSGAMWMLNSVAIGKVDLDAAPAEGVERDHDGRPTGRLFRLDRWLATAVPPVPTDVGRLSRELLTRGVTGVTDATPGKTPADLADLVARRATGEIKQRLHLMAPAGAVLPPRAGDVTLGPVKVLLDDDRLPELDATTAFVADAHAIGRGVAFHCVTPTQLVFALTALDAAGATAADRIEHGSVIHPDVLPLLRRLGPTVVTQPNFVAERGDGYLTDVDPKDQPHLYRAASLIGAGIPLAAGTDAPFGDPNPWAAIAAAIDRRTAAGSVLGGEETLAPRAALALFLGAATDPAAPRRIAPGQPGDVCLLAEPIDDALAHPHETFAVAAVVAGELHVVDE